MDIRRAMATSARIGALVLLGGVAAGVVGGAMAWLLLQVQTLTYGVATDSLLDDVRGAGQVRRVAGPLVGGLLAGLGWWWLRRRARIVGVDRALEPDGPRLPLRSTLADALLQILVVGSGASIGREGAPRQASAALAEALAGRLRVAPDVRRAAVAAAAGAGLAAVYNVPLAGMIFTLETLPTARGWRARAAGTLIAAAMSAIATVTAWPVVGNRPTYVFPGVAWDDRTGPWAAGWAALCIPLCALVGIGFARLAGAAQTARPAPTWRLPLAVAAASGVVGAVSIRFAALPGNGKDLMQLAFSAEGSLLVFGVLFVLKPLATALCLRSGAVGGLLTPALATGAALGGLVAGLFALVAPADVARPHIAVFALVAAAGVLAVTQRAPLFAAVMAWELTRAPLWTAPLLLVTAYGAHLARGATGRAISRRREAAARGA